LDEVSEAVDDTFGFDDPAWICLGNALFDGFWLIEGQL
jgi:hypothetical protein